MHWYQFKLRTRISRFVDNKDYCLRIQGLKKVTEVKFWAESVKRDFNPKRIRITALEFATTSRLKNTLKTDSHNPDE